MISSQIFVILAAGLVAYMVNNKPAHGHCASEFGSLELARLRLEQAALELLSCPSLPIACRNELEKQLSKLLSCIKHKEGSDAL